MKISQQVKSPLLSPNSEITSAIGRKLSREWGSGLDLSRSSEALSSTQTPKHQPSKDEPIPTTRRKKSRGGGDLPPKPIRRARSHENKDDARRYDETASSSRLSGQSVLGRQATNVRSKKKLESELKAILTARAHHFELHPP